MSTLSTTELKKRSCAACDGGVEKLSALQVKQQLTMLDGWQLTHDGQRIRKDWQVEDFMAGLDFLDLIAELAETEGHHPDFHLEEYRHVWVEIWTHAVGGLTESDFILAVKIDGLPVELKN